MSFRKSVTMTRRTGGAHGEDGRWTPGTPEEISILASVQPLNARDYSEIQADGVRTRRAVKIYTDTELFPARPGIQREADILNWRGARWEIVQCDPYQMGVISHFKAYALEAVDYAGSP